MEQTVSPELINVHRVQGPSEVVQFLKSADQEYVEGLFYNAKHVGQTSFPYAERTYDLVRNRDASFSVRLSPEQVVTTESLS